MRSWCARCSTVALIALSAVHTGEASQVQAIAAEMPVLAQALAKQLTAGNVARVAAIDFTDIQGRPNELGRFLADQLTIDLVMTDGITVIDRANLSAIMAEHKLTAEGLVNPENARRLGQFAGVEAILVGTLATIDGAVMLTVRGISTDTSEVVAAGRSRVALTDDVRRMLGLSVSTAALQALPGTAAALGGSDPAGSATAVSAPVPVGPIVATAKGINYRVAGNGAGAYPQILVTIEFENRNLDASVAIAANSQVVPKQSAQAPTTGYILGTLQDPSGMTWVLGQGSLRGLPIVYGFETDSGGFSSELDRVAQITQNAPSNVADYIRRAVEYDGSGLRNVTQRLWAGSFAAIEPGGSIEVTAIFVPSDAATAGGRGERGSRTATSQSFTVPESLDLSLELVLATVRDGESPQKAADLALRNLTISRLVLPRAGGQ